MAIYHLHVQMISKADGRTAVAAAAYRSGTVIESDYMATTFDYSKKKGVVHSEVTIPAHTPAEYADRSTLWNAVEKAEKNKNAQVAREVELALPVEWSHDQQVAVMRDFVRSTFVDDGMCADWSIHDKGDGNPHCHILLTTRAISKDGKWESKGKRGYKLDENGEKIPIIDPVTGEQKIGANGRKMWQREYIERNPWDSKDLVLEWRKEWELTANRYLEQEQQISCESYEKQGIDLEPTGHEGPAARAMEARGEVADRCEYNREVRERNSLKQTLKQMAKELVAEFRETLDGYVRFFQDGLERLRELKHHHEQEPVVPVQMIEPDFDDYDYEENYDEDVPFSDEEIAAIWEDYLASAEEPENDRKRPKKADIEPDQWPSDRSRWGIAHEPAQNDVLEPISGIENRQDSPNSAKNEPDLSTYRPATPHRPTENKLIRVTIEFADGLIHKETDSQIVIRVPYENGQALRRLTIDNDRIKAQGHRNGTRSITFETTEKIKVDRLKVGANGLKRDGHELHDPADLQAAFTAHLDYLRSLRREPEPAPVYPSYRATYRRPVYEPEPAHEDEQEQDLGPEL